jgi:hypothetical protein
MPPTIAVGLTTQLDRLHSATTPLAARHVLTSPAKSASLNVSVVSNTPLTVTQLLTANQSWSFRANTWGYVWHQSSLLQLVDACSSCSRHDKKRQMLRLEVFWSLCTWGSLPLYGMAHGSQLSPQFHHYYGHQWRTEGWGGSTPPKFRSFDKAELNSQFRGKYIRNNLIRICVSLICKLSGTPD